MTDFEARIATLLNEHVDSELGPQRAVPPLRIATRPVAPRSDQWRRWAAPLAAACVVAAVLAVVLAVRQRSDHRIAPATHFTGWQRINLPNSGGFDGQPTVGFSDDRHGWILGTLYRPHGPAIDAIWTSADAGSSWAEHVLRFAGSGTVVAATFGDAQHGWLLRSHRSTYDIYATADGGATWTLQATRGGNADGIVSVDAEHAWAYGRNGMAATTDGAAWVRRNVPADVVAGSVQFVDATRGWLVGTDGAGSFTTADGGQTWQRLPTPGGRRLGASLDFVSPLDGWAITPHRAFATSDGGRTWRAKLGRSHSQLTTAAFWDADQGWVFGSVNGRPAALRTADGGQTWIRSDLPSGYVLDAASRGCVAVAVTSTKAFRSSRCG